MKQINSKTTGDQYTAIEFDEGVRGELQNMVSNTGQTFNEADQTQLGQSVTRIASTILNYADVGAVNSYVLNSITSTFDLGIYENGMVIGFNPANTNTGASTANINGLGAKNIVDLAGAALIGGELSILTYTYLQYDEGNDRFILMPINAVDAALKNELAITATPGTAGGNLVGLNNTFLSAPLKEITTQDFVGNLFLVAAEAIHIGGGIYTVSGHNVASATSPTTGTVDIIYTTATLTNGIIFATPILTTAENNISLVSSNTTGATYSLRENNGNTSFANFSFMICVLNF